MPATNVGCRLSALPSRVADIRSRGLQKRQLWVSVVWAERHKGIFDLLNTLVESPTSKWMWLCGNTAEFIAARKRLKGNLIGLVTPGERAANTVRLLVDDMNLLCLGARCLIKVMSQ